MVRENRKALLGRVIEAGHDVDPVVTADTRRIIRLPGTLHGSTGWVCSVLEEGMLERPVGEWISDISKHENASSMPRRPPIQIPRFKSRKKTAARSSPVISTSQEFVSLEVSSHVPGTKDRSAFVAWLPVRWGGASESIERAQDRKSVV